VNRRYCACGRQIHVTIIPSKYKPHARVQFGVTAPHHDLCRQCFRALLDRKGALHAFHGEVKE